MPAYTLSGGLKLAGFDYLKSAYLSYGHCDVHVYYVKDEPPESASLSVLQKKVKTDSPFFCTTFMKVASLRLMRLQSYERGELSLIFYMFVKGK